MRNTMRLVATVILTASALSACLDSGNQTSFDGSGGSNTGGSSNQAPVIYGNPPRGVLVNNMYDFEPQASDADGDSLTFSIQNQPRWASFDPATGRLSGQPLLGDIGTYSNVRISVSDGMASTSLSAFTLTVSQTALGSVTLNWTPPQENTDGTPLSDLAGYKIYFGPSSRNYDHEIQIYNAGTTTYVVDNLPPDTYYFAATAVNSSGLESDYSGEAIRTVN